MIVRMVLVLMLLMTMVVNAGMIPAQAAVGTPQTQTARVASAPEPTASTTADVADIAFKPIGTYKGEGAEIVDYDPKTERLFITTGDGVDIVDISDPTAPEQYTYLTIAEDDPIYGTPQGYEGPETNSLAVYSNTVAVAFADDAPGVYDFIAFYDTDGNALTQVGAANYHDSLPDMVTFTKDGTKLLVANEGEPINEYELDGSDVVTDTEDPEGSVSIIDLSNVMTDTSMITDVHVTTIDFRQFNEGGSKTLPEGVRIFGPDASVAQDLEPEYIALSDDGKTAWVTLQENNALAVLDIESDTIITDTSKVTVTDIVALGTKDYNQEANALDASNKDDTINITTWPVKGFYMPDAIASFTVDGETYLITANEGDARDYDGFSEEVRVEDLTLDAEAFPNAEELQQEENLGRLKTTTANGDTDGDGKHEEIYAYGARSFSIWNASGELEYDSGNQIAQITAGLYPEYFNADYDDDEDVFEFDDRSDDKGAEPEGVTTGVISDTTYAFVGLERMGGIMVYNVNDPSAPSFVQYINTTNYEGKLADGTAGDIAPEGLVFIPADESPTGKALLVVAHEGSKTTTIFEASDPNGGGTLTVLHNNDGESSLAPLEYGTSAGKLPVGGVATFKSVMQREIMDARGNDNSVLSVYAGDAFLAGAVMQCTKDVDYAPFYDAVAQRQMPYDAHIIGNHEFDFEPGVLKKFIEGFEINGVLQQPFLSANLDFSEQQDPSFDALLDSDNLVIPPITDGRVLARAAIITDRHTGQRFGIVGMSPTYLKTISSPEDVIVLDNVAELVQEQIDRIQNDYGVNKILFVSHLQSLENDKELIPQLSGIDVVVAGGGDELLLNPDVDEAMQKLPGETVETKGEYPMEVTDKDGNTVYVVTGPGNYKYLGRLDVVFDDNGEVSSIVSDKSYPRRVIPTSEIASALDVTDVVSPDMKIMETVIEPIQPCLDEYLSPVAGTEVLLDVSKPGVRSKETNSGNLIADSYIYAYGVYTDTTPANPLVAVQNGGGIRQNAGNVLPRGAESEASLPGIITELDIIDVMAFSNDLSVIRNVTPTDLKEVLEHSASRLPDAGGQFLQIAGLQVTYNISQTAQVNEDGRVTTAGERVREVMLDNGTVIVKNGEVVAGAPNVDLLTNSYTAGGGDAYFWFANNTDQALLRDNNGQVLSYRQAWTDYLKTFPEKEIDGQSLPTIPASDERYQAGGEGRITIETGEPTDGSDVVEKSFSASEGGTIESNDLVNGNPRVSATFQPNSFGSGVVSVTAKLSMITPTHSITKSVFAFTLDMTNAETGEEITRFNPRYTMTLRYTDEELAAAGVDEDSMDVVYWDEDESRWVSLKDFITSVDTTSNEVMLALDHLTEFAHTAAGLAQGPNYYVYLPTVGKSETP